MIYKAKLLFQLFCFIGSMYVHLGSIITSLSLISMSSNFSCVPIRLSNNKPVGNLIMPGI